MKTPYKLVQLHTVYCQELLDWSQTDLPEIILYPLINGWQKMFRVCVAAMARVAFNEILYTGSLEQNPSRTR